MIDDDDKPKTRRKVTPLFVPDPGELSDQYTGEPDMFGRPGDAATAESVEAASQWDARHWRRGVVR